MTTNIQAADAKQNALTLAIEQAVTAGDLSRLNPEQRLFYYKQVCESAGLNPLTRPLDFITLNGKLVLYAKKDATDQLRRLRGISIIKVEKEIQDGMCIVTAYAKDASGKEDCDVGALPIGHLKGDAYANALMKCITKAKRRVTLSICGMGLNDETEVEGLPGAELSPIDLSSGAAEKTESKTTALKDKLGAIKPAKAEVIEPPKEEPKPKQPEVLPPKQKAAPKQKAEPTDAEVVLNDLGEIKVPLGRLNGRKLKDLDDAGIRDTDAALQDLPEQGPRIKAFAAAFYDFCDARSAGAKKELDTPPPAPPKPKNVDEGINEFFEESLGEVFGKEQSEAEKVEERLFNGLRNAKSMDELKIAWGELGKAAKTAPLSIDKLPPAEGKAWIEKASKVRDECKKKFSK